MTKTRTWSTLYVVQAPDGRILLVQKSGDGCTRTVQKARWFR